MDALERRWVVNATLFGQVRCAYLPYA